MQWKPTLITIESRAVTSEINVWTDVTKDLRRIVHGSYLHNFIHVQKTFVKTTFLPNRQGKVTVAREIGVTERELPAPDFRLHMKKCIKGRLFCRPFTSGALGCPTLTTKGSKLKACN